MQRRACGVGAEYQKVDLYVGCREIGPGAQEGADVTGADGQQWLASAPELLMLDEPSMGLAPAVADSIFERIREIHRVHALTVLLVEQRVVEALEACDHGYVLETGRVALHGPYTTLLSDPRVKRAYLGI